MFRKTIALIFALTTFSLLIKAQNPAIEVIYKMVNNGKVDTANTYHFYFFNNVAYLSSDESANKGFIDFNRKELVDILQINDLNYKTITPFSTMESPEDTGEKETILGYNCNKVVYKAFSNTIEVWYTIEAEAKGSPYKNYMPANSLVLKTVINGNRELIATEIKQLEEKIQLSYPYDLASEISKAEARELQIKSRYINVPVFNKQQVNFGGEILNPEFGLPDTTYRLSNGTVILKKIKLPEISRKGALVFATVTNWSNGDAYDRTASLFTISGKKDITVLNALTDSLGVMPFFMDKEGEKYQGFTSTTIYEVPVELMRFFTSFGVSHFNTLREINNYDWADSVVYKQDITALVPNTEEEIWIGVFIGNYDKGGHLLSLDLQFYPPWSDETVGEKYINPLFNTVNILEMSGQNYGRFFDTDSLEMEFILPENIEDLKLLYTTTGHGGWGGGDEFNPKLNQIFIDDSLVFSHIPWRTDCATYRMLNPASGNFENGLSSSDLSRSNWCPATLTPPFIIPLNNLLPGKHVIRVTIDQGEDEGSAFSHWGVCGVLTGSIFDKE